MKSNLFTILITTILILIVQCTQDYSNSTNPQEDFSIKVRLQEEPARLNPFLATTRYETQVLNLIFQPMAEYDPYSLEYVPVLLKTIAEKQIVGPNEKFAGEVSYAFTIKEDAQWSDGTPVIAEDYLFSAKLPFLPQINATTVLGYLRNILEITLNKDDPKKFSVVVEKEYILSLEACTNFQIYPKHHYDPENLLGGFSFQDLRYAEEKELDLNVDTSISKFASAFTSEKYSRSQIVGSGPYTIDQWETGQYLSFNKIDPWWGSKYSSTNSLFRAYPSRIIYQFILDETVAMTSLKDGQIDIMSINDPVKFLELKEDPTYAEEFHFLTSRIPVYYYIGLNNQNPVMKDPRVRKALAYTLDVDQIVNDLMYGTAIRTVGPIHPGKSYYNTEIDPIKIDIEKAKELLLNAGWKDTNENGIVDKKLDGQLTELTLRFFVTQQELGRKTALLLKESAAKAGVQIELITKPDYNTIAKEHISKGDFELVALASGISPADYDPYQNWHSDNFEVGSNMLGFADDKADAIIEELRLEEDADERTRLYKEFQYIVHEKQAAIFLFSPANLIVVNKNFKVVPAERRPGYFENHLTQFKN